MTRYFLVLLLGLATAGSSLADTQSLKIALVGIQHERGTVRVGLYRQPDTFRKEAKALAVQQAAATVGTVEVAFSGLEPGEYAVMAYHDENANGQLDRRFGMFPIEGYGLSNNPEVMGPPAFKDSAFNVGGGTTAISIDVRY
ncbi:DUF2141 domain-containing protein [Pseudomonas lopnurensis]|uniref:DUF2141 domain-containing protein n=1 Tax=Pseudomonas lopnurensis TaxID=1477517 RepID=UPI001879C4E6|nr:DUF2141 domain-containing protein [Pseudomonas lopnurensis]MBE7373062.1 DUF2141 domain-containing protein [Pseudomonas lopnurensis]